MGTEELDCMAARPIHEMPFSDFANAIVPTGGAGLASGGPTSGNRQAWMATLWSTVDCHVTFYVTWRRSPLAQALPPNALRYEFDDEELYAPTSALGLDPKSKQDSRKTAELLAIRSAWQAAVQQLVSEKRYSHLGNDVANDFVLLSCQWTMHPWVQEQVSEYKKNKALALARQPATAPVFSEDPRWPNTEVVFIESDQPQDQDCYLSEKETIGYWVNRFDSENRGWSSAFAIDAWYAANDIVLANNKIVALESLIDAQRAHIQHLEKIVRQNKRRDAELSSSHGKPGRPPLSPERQTIARQFAAKWVKSLMAALEVESCARLEEIVSNSSQRNWRRWLSGAAVPTQSSLTELQTAKVLQGRNKGRLLKDMATSPTYDELLQLMRLIPLSRGCLPRG